MKIPCLKPALFIVLACVVMPGAPKPAVQERVEFAETGELGISLPASRIARLHTLPAEIAVADYSLEYARRTLVPAMGGSMTVGDFDGDGQQDLYVVVPGGSNHLFRNNGKRRFSDVTGIATYNRSGKKSSIGWRNTRIMSQTGQTDTSRYYAAVIERFAFGPTTPNSATRGGNRTDRRSPWRFGCDLLERRSAKISPHLGRLFFPRSKITAIYGIKLIALTPNFSQNSLFHRIDRNSLPLYKAAQ